MKNILMLSSTLPRWKDDSESNWVLELSKHLNHNTIILAPWAKDARRDETMDEIRIHRFKYSLTEPKLCYGAGILYNLKNSFMAKLQAMIFPLAQLFSMRKIIKRDKIDKVIAWWIIPQGITAVVNKKLFKTPYICIACGTDILALKSWPFRMIQKFIFKNAEKVIVTSTVLQKEVKQRFPDIVPAIIPVGINSYFKPKEKVPGKVKKLLCVGRLTPQKGFDTAIQALALLKQDAQLDIIGEGQDLDRLKKMAGSLNVNFLGKKSNKELVRYYQEADIFILPSKGFEALGMVCAEAMACGTPVIASNLEGLGDIVIDKKTGLTFREGDAEDLKDKILLCNNEYTKEAETYIKANFTWPNIAKKYMEMI